MDVVLNQRDGRIDQPPTTERQDRRGDQVASRLAASGYPSLRNVQCEVSEDVMVLSGTVSSYYLKQMAQTVAGQTDGVGRVKNRLQVRSTR